MVLMKKMSFLALVLAIVVLPGCCCKKKESAVQTTKRSTPSRYIETSMDTEGDVEDNDMQDMDIDTDDLGDLDDIDFSGEDLDEDELNRILAEIEGEEGNLEESVVDEDEDLSGMLDEYSETAELMWVDEQADDELRKLYFAFNHYGIKADQKNALTYDIEQVKQLIAEAGNVQPTVVIEGHACQEGTRSYNIGLSEKRAKVVADLFVEAGVDKSLIKVIGRGQECPVVLNGKTINGSREERAPNRRVEVRVIYT